jgi:hypothetical protein
MKRRLSLIAIRLPSPRGCLLDTATQLVGGENPNGLWLRDS